MYEQETYGERLAPHLRSFRHTFFRTYKIESQFYCTAELHNSRRSGSETTAIVKIEKNYGKTVHHSEARSQWSLSTGQKLQSCLINGVPPGITCDWTRPIDLDQLTPDEFSTDEPSGRECVQRPTALTEVNIWNFKFVRLEVNTLGVVFICEDRDVASNSSVLLIES